MGSTCVNSESSARWGRTLGGADGGIPDGGIPDGGIEPGFLGGTRTSGNGRVEGDMGGREGGFMGGSGRVPFGPPGGNRGGGNVPIPDPLGAAAGTLPPARPWLI